MNRMSAVMARRFVVFLVLLSIVLAAVACGTKNYRCPTRGMLPTVYVGDVFKARLNPYSESSPSRGDIVVFKVPAGSRLWATKQVFKRIIGLARETIEIREFQVFINGEALNEPYAQLPDAEMLGRMPLELRNTPPTEIPPGHCFVLGDNRGNSVDSRHFGLIEIGTIMAKALVVVRSDHKGQKGKDLSVSPY